MDEMSIEEGMDENSIIKDMDESRRGPLSTEQIYQTREIPSWKEQLTIRAFAVSLILGSVFSFIVIKINLTIAILPSFNMAAGMLGYCILAFYTKILTKCDLLKNPFTRQENTIIISCVNAITGIACNGGFGSFLLAMTKTIASQTEERNLALNTKNLSLGWIIGFLFVVSFVGLFSALPLRKIMIIDHKLIYPSATATAHLINTFHTSQGAKLVKRQVYALFKCVIFSFFWAFFQWFYTGGDNCGFASFPTLGIKAYENSFYFDFSATYVAIGMICPYIINISMLAGSILSWGIMWPLIEAKKGDWYSDTLSAKSLHGLQGYKVFVGMAMILGNGLFNFANVLVKTIRDIYKNYMKKESSSVLPVAGHPPMNSADGFDDIRRKEIFLKDQIPTKYAFASFIFLATVSIVTVPQIFPQLKWYHMLVTFVFAPVLAFCNAYGCGLTDISLAATYGQLATVLFGAWVGPGHGGILVGLASGVVMMSIVSSATYLMEDYKTAYLTLASPRSMFISQVIGTAMGCVIGPVVFWIFYKVYPLGVTGSEYPAPYAALYRGMALFGVEGIDSLPKHCITLCIVFFIATFLISAAKEAAKNYNWRVQYFLPNAMAMAIPFFLGSYFTIDMCLGSLILFLWQKMNFRQAEAFAPAIASGMICGEGIWSLPSSLLSLGKVKPPICMKFLSRSTNAKVDDFLIG